jgi:acyl-coenzyme A thioesterase PaaI-like protein
MSQTRADDVAGSDRHFVDLLALQVWSTDLGPRGRSRLRPSMWTPGTQRPRVGVVATMVDMIGGLVPEGFMTPTVDLRFSVVDALPSEGTLDLETDTIKLGRTLLVSETLVRCEGRLVARGTTTFLSDFRRDLSLYRDDSEPDVDVVSFDDVISARIIDDATLELDPHQAITNDLRGTIQGGVQATFAELAAEHVLGRSGIVTDLEIRYLRAMKAGPLHARAEVLGTHEGTASVRVLLTDAGADHRVVSYSALSAKVS